LKRKTFFISKNLLMGGGIMLEKMFRQRQEAFIQSMFKGETQTEATRTKM